jgi:hypothetical protein
MDDSKILNQSLGSNIDDLRSEFDKLKMLVDSLNFESKRLEGALYEHTSRSKNELNELNQLKCFYNTTKLKADTVEADVQKKTYEMNSLIYGLNFE